MEDDSDSFFCLNTINFDNKYYNHLTNKNSNIRNDISINKDNNIEMDIFPIDSLPFQNNNEDMFFSDMTFNFQCEDLLKQKAEDKTDKILNKINKFEDTYYNNIISLPNTDVKLHDKQILAKNLNLIENTLPGLLISYLYKNNNLPVLENILFAIVLKQFNDLRKPNGSKYKGNINKVFKSTLSSSGIFYRSHDGRWNYKEKEAIDYVLRVTEKLLTKKIQTEKKSAVMQDETRFTNSEKKQPKKIKKKLDDVNYKIVKVYGILDDLLNKYKNDKQFGNVLKNPFKNINSSIELLQKIGNDNQCVGILMCFKFFKSIINKFMKFTKKHKKSEELLNGNCISDKIDLLNNKIDFIEKYFFAEKKLKKSKHSDNTLIQYTATSHK